MRCFLVDLLFWTQIYQMTHLNDTCEGFGKLYYSQKTARINQYLIIVYHFYQNTLGYCGEIPIILFAGESHFIDNDIFIYCYFKN